MSEDWVKVMKIIRDELAAAKVATPKRLPRTYNDLAALLTGVSGTDIQNWMRSGERQSKPKISQLPEIAQALASDFPASERAAKTEELKLKFARALGLVSDTDDSVAEIGLAIHELQARMLRLHASIAGATTTSGIPAIVQRAIDKNLESQATGKGTRWAIAVWPAIEGPEPGPHLYVGDRVDFAKTDRTPVTEKEVGNDFGDLLGGAALPVRSEWSWPRWVWPDTAPHVSSWIVPRVAGIKEAIRPTAWAGVTS
ncbi:hypothetical protein, partial [Nocardia salmonicida]